MQGILDKIEHANMEVTRACNLRCGYCFNSSGVKLPEELSLEDWKKAIDTSCEYGATSILVTGGEVMLRKDSPEIIHHALTRGLRTSILSNGLRLSDGVEEIVRPLERVQISLDSASPYTHDLRRGKGSWKTARAAIDYVRGLNTPVEISIPITEESLDELEGVVGIAYLTGSKVLARPLQPIGRAHGLQRYESHEDLLRKKQSLEQRFGQIFVEDFAHYVPVLGANHDNTMIPKGFVTVLPDGTIRGTDQNILQLRKSARYN